MQKSDIDAFSRRLIDTLIRERQARGLTHERLAAKAKISRQAIGKIESGLRNPTMLTVYKLARAMDMTLEEFVHHMEM